MYVIIAIIAAGFALFYCSYQIRLGAYVRSLCRNRAAGRVVALTFDDEIGRASCRERVCLQV